jgi:hypothetical protein
VIYPVSLLHAGGEASQPEAIASGSASAFSTGFEHNGVRNRLIRFADKFVENAPMD